MSEARLLVSEKLELDLRTAPGLERFIDTYWSMLQQAVEQGHNPLPQVLHFVDKDPHTGAPRQALITQVEQDPERLKTIAVQYGTFALALIYPSASAIVIVVEHPAGDRAYMGRISRDAGAVLGDHAPAPEILAAGPRVLDSIGRSVQ